MAPWSTVDVHGSSDQSDDDRIVTATVLRQIGDATASKHRQSPASSDLGRDRSGAHRRHRVRLSVADRESVDGTVHPESARRRQTSRLGCAHVLSEEEQAVLVKLQRTIRPTWNAASNRWKPSSSTNIAPRRNMGLKSELRQNWASSASGSTARTKERSSEYSAASPKASGSAICWTREHRRHRCPVGHRRVPPGRTV